MKIIICGAGQVGTSIATQLAGEGNDVTVVDINPDIIRDVNQNQDIRGIVGHGSHPDVLEKAGAENADMIIAASPSDEVNMVACQVAHTIFKIPKKIARLRSSVYRDPLWNNLFSQDRMPIDVIISPEYEIAKSIHERLSVPGAFNVITFEEDTIRLIGVICDRDCPVIHTALEHFESLFPDIEFKVVCITRDGKTFIPKDDDQIFPGDEVYFVTPSHYTLRVMALFGHEEPNAQRVMIVGGGNVGFYLAKMIEELNPDIQITIVERNEKQSRKLSEALEENITVIKGDGLNHEILEEGKIKSTETVVMVTNDDETNILGGLIAKRHGTQRVVALVNKKTYSPIIGHIGLDTVVSPEVISVATILQYIRRGRVKAVRRLWQNQAEIIELEATDSSKVIHTPIKDIKLPPETMIGCLIREKETIIPNETDEIRAGDKVILVDTGKHANEISDLFAPHKQYF